MNRIAKYLDDEPTPKKKTKKREITQYQSRGWHIPLELVYAMESKEITEEEFILLSRIENLVHYGKGCFASNEWFAIKKGCTVRQVQRIISTLKKRGFIQTRTKNGQRLMKTKWSKEIKDRNDQQG
jgi:hypothetical protein